MEEKKTVKTAIAKASQHKNYFLAIFLVIFIGGYAFFFSSTYWMPTESKTSATEIGSAQTINDREFTLVSWDYSREDQVMEVEFGVRNHSVESENKYEVSVLERTQGELNTEYVVKTDDLLVIRITGLTNRWREISVHIGFEGNGSYLKFYTNRQAVTHVDKIDNLSQDEYYAAKYRGEIAECEAEMDSYEMQISENMNEIVEYEERIAELEEEKQYQTNTEIQETDSLISTIKSSIQSLEAENESLTEEIRELEEKIELDDIIMKEHMQE